PLVDFVEQCGAVFTDGNTVVFRRKWSTNRDQIQPGRVEDDVQGHSVVIDHGVNVTVCQRLQGFRCGRVLADTLDILDALGCLRTGRAKLNADHFASQIRGGLDLARVSLANYDDLPGAEVRIAEVDRLLALVGDGRGTDHDIVLTVRQGREDRVEQGVVNV